MQSGLDHHDNEINRLRTNCFEFESQIEVHFKP